jgi:hypothetical protein
LWTVWLRDDSLKLNFPHIVQGLKNRAGNFSGPKENSSDHNGNGI